jgi:hypothetical protein
MTYVERYANGEYEQVWDDLRALGAAVREEQVYPDALAVARETMRRVRQDIEELIQRLLHIGFVFGYDHLLLTALSSPVITRHWDAYFEMLSWVREQPPVFLPGNILEETLARHMNTRHALKRSSQEEADSYRQAWRGDPTRPPDMKHTLEQLEQDIGPIPLSLRAWYEEVGAVNFFGYHAGWNTLVRSFQPTLYQAGKLAPLNVMARCDPLQACVLDTHRLAALHQYHEPGQPYELCLAPDRYLKNHQSGGGCWYLFLLPNADADTVLWEDPVSTTSVTFVQYLRTSLLKWAGFPGMADWPSVPQDDLTFLTEGLIPF